MFDLRDQLIGAERYSRRAGGWRAEHGKSAYEMACDKGFVGTEDEWLLSLRGLSALAIARLNGFTGSQSEWLESLQASPPAVSVHSTTTGAAGTNASVTNFATDGSLALDFVIPRGADATAPTFSVGTVTTVAAGQPASVSMGGTALAISLSFQIPAGANATPPNITIGTVTTLAAGASATASLSGTYPNLALSLGIPIGATGPAESSFVGTVTISQNAAIAIALGIREVTVALTGAVVGARYLAFADSFRLNGGTLTLGRPAGYSLIDCVCNTANQITISLNAPLLAIGASYAITCSIYRIT